MNNKTIHRFKLLSTTISFMLLISALLSVSDTPAMDYELSIYSSTPTIFWVAIIFGLLNGFLLIVSDIYIRTRNMWIVGLFQILFCNFSVISLYALRGYVLYLGRGDVSTHVGLAKDIINFGNFGSNFYPVTSVLISQISQLTNLSILIISKYISSLFFVLYSLSIYCWSKSIMTDRKFILSSLIASSPIFFAFFSTSIYPMLFSVLTIPFFFYLLKRNQDYRFRFFSIILAIIYPFFHPITAIVSFLYLVVMYISEKLNLSAERNVSPSLVLISFVSLSGWLIHQYGLLGSIERIFLQLSGVLQIQTTSQVGFSYFYRLGILTSVRTLLFMISDDIVFYVLSLCAIYILLRKDRSIMDKFSKITMCFVIGSLLLLIIFFSIYAHSPMRLINLNYNMVLTPPLVGFLLYNFLVNDKRAKTFLVLSLIFISGITAVFSVYPSPITIRPNEQTTIREVKGMDWLITQKRLELEIANILSPVTRYADLIYGCSFRLGRRDLISDLIIPDHFGFTGENVFPIDEDRYLIITEFEIRGYTEVWSDIDRFRIEDFIKINLCKNVDKIYENGEFTTYFVHNYTRRSVE